MRGTDVIQGAMFSYISLEERVPKTHPLRRMRLLVDGVLASMSAQFAARYSHTGRPSVAPEKLLRRRPMGLNVVTRASRRRPGFDGG